ncbi:MAG: biotin/lipoyl-binding protein, partial [Lachnospiraceae bacterium]|nr:biotin/lipoyl-binding protein [Lachnospiraceae bacterium]
MSEPITKKKTSGKKLALIIIPSILVLLIIAIVIIGSIIGKALMNVGLPVNVVKPEVNDISASVVTSGTISSANITAYTTSVSATVKDIYIRPGQPISAGDTILTFDTTDLENQYNQASLNARSTQLSSQSTVEASNKTSSDLEQAKANVTSLKAKITALE